MTSTKYLGSEFYLLGGTKFLLHPLLQFWKFFNGEGEIKKKSLSTCTLLDKHPLLVHLKNVEIFLSFEQTSIDLLLPEIKAFDPFKMNLLPSCLAVVLNEAASLVKIFIKNKNNRTSRAVFIMGILVHIKIKMKWL